MIKESTIVVCHQFQQFFSYMVISNVFGMEYQDSSNIENHGHG